MTEPANRRRLLQCSLALGASLALPKARACEFFAANLRITHPWAHATPQNAPFALVSMKFDEVTQADTLVSVETPVATGFEFVGAELTSTDFAIAPGRETLLGERGTHLRLTGLQMPLELARTYPLKLVFAKSGSVNTTLSVDYARFR
jgi:copper(I)-binding protein